MMTPTQLELSARRRYNAVNDSFWSQAEMLDLIFQAEMELAVECLCIQNKYTTTTVASQQAYAWPTRAISIKRVTYDGSKIDPIDMREDDAISLSNTTSIATGTPQFYFSWERSVYLQPVPSEAKTLNIWTYDYPETVVITSPLSVPAEYQPGMVYYMLAEMATKDGNFALADRYRTMWQQEKSKALKLEAKRKRGDGPARIKDIERLAQSSFGTL
jgi:hypothetical protein